MKTPYYYGDILKICENNHLTADEIFVKLKKKYPTVWISTIYRNLKYLTKVWKLKKITSLWKKTYFEKNKWFHIHLFDKANWKIIDLAPENFNIKLPKNFEVEDINLNIIWKFEK